MMFPISAGALALPHWSPAVGSVLGLCAILVWRVRETGRAVSVKNIVIPPLGMATGMSMFIMERFRVPWLWALAALLTGAGLLAWPLIHTTRLERRGDDVILHRSKALFVVIFGLAAIRFAARGYFDTLLTGGQTAALAYLLAFGMIAHWRVRMLFDYRSLR